MDGQMMAGAPGDYNGHGGGRGPPDAGRRGFRGTAENAKTKLCMRWMSPEGCRFGDRCNFAHGEHELRKLPPRGGPGGGRGQKDGGGRGFGGYGGNGGGWQDGGYGEGRGPGFDDFYRGNYGVRPPFGGSGGFGGPFPSQVPPGASMGGGSAGGFNPMGGGQVPNSGIPGGGRTPQESMENMAWIASGCPVTGPAGWTQYRCAETGEYYYHNHRTNQTTWDKPPEWGA